MPRTIKADGRTITVPDDATDDEINQIVGPGPAPTPETIGGRIKSYIGDRISALAPSSDPSRPTIWNTMPGTHSSLPGEDIMAAGMMGNGIPSRVTQAAGAGARAAAPKLLTKIPYVGPVLEAAGTAAKEAWNSSAPKPPVQPDIDYSSIPGLGPRPSTRVPGPIVPIPHNEPMVGNLDPIERNVPYRPKPIIPESGLRPINPPPKPIEGLTITQGKGSGPLPLVKPMNIAGPMPPPAEGGFMPKAEPPEIAPKLIQRPLSEPGAPVKTLDENLGDLREQYGLPRKTSKANYRYDEGSGARGIIRYKTPRSLGDK